MSDEERISLPALASALRRNIDEMRAQLTAAGKAAILDIDSAEIELSVAIERTKGGEGGVSFSILGIGASGKGKYESSNATGHKLTLTLKPKGSIGVASKGSQTF